ncbi:MAG: tetratricopeptide repeat protein, partial [Candidatus Kapabacteria bacterium]|nr:tetratricopeptide repeat protein [Candidatus Kapabacteria bacterium]MDW7997330.1 tetratricopeptide repeat protein [Bacteroidota bacterium]
MDSWKHLHPELQDRLRHARDDYERMDIANDFAWDQRYTIPRSATDAVEYAQSLASELGYERGQAYCLRNRAALHFFTGSAEDALAAAQTALRWFESQDDPAGIIPTLLVLGGVHHRLAQFDKAYEQFARALELSDRMLQELPDDPTIRKNWAAAYGNIGGVYIALGQVEQGLRYLSEAYHRQVELEDKRGLGITAGSIAGAYVQLGRLEEAKPFLEQACRLLRETGTTYMLAVALSNLGHLAALQHRWDEAQQYQEESLMLRREIKDELGEAVTLSTIAVIHFHQGRRLDAFHELRDVLKTFQRLRDVNLEVKVRRELGDMHVAMQDVQVALQHYQIGMQLAHRHGMLLWEMEFNRLCARVHEDRGELALALEYYKRYWALYERLLGQRRQQAIAVMEKQLEVERLRYEQELYRLRNEELAQALAEVERQRAETEHAYAEYQRAMEERLRLVSILSHELRNLVGGIMTNAELIINGLDRLERPIIIQTADYILRASEYLRDELQLLSRWQMLEVEGAKHYYQVDDLLEL